MNSIHIPSTNRFTTAMSALHAQGIDSQYLGSENPERIVAFVPGGPGTHHSYMTPLLSPLYGKKTGVLLFSPGSSGALDMPGMVGEMHRVMASFDPADIVFLYGHSAGSATILEYLKAHGRPDCVKGLIFESWVHDASYTEQPVIHSNPFLELFLPKSERKPNVFPKNGKTGWINRKWEQVFRNAWLQGLALAFSAGFQGQGKAMIESLPIDPALMLWATRNYLPSFDLNETLRGVDVPILSLAGMADGVVPVAHIKAGIAINPRIQAAWFEGAKHFVSLERNRDVLKRVKKFMDDSETMSGLR